MFFNVSGQSTEPYRIGVLLPSTGDSAMGYFEILNWTVENLNKEGVGRTIELVPVDTSKEPALSSAKRLLNDPEIKVVIGPATSGELLQIAPEFIKAKKLLISSTASSEEISKKFNNSGYIWRTVAGDQRQVKLIMDHLAGLKTENVTLLYENSTYGKTYYNQSEYYAKKDGLTLIGRVQFEHSANLSEPVTSALYGDPDYIIVAAQGSDAANITRIVHEQNSKAGLFYTDAGRTETFPDIAGADAEGARGFSPTANRTTGFFVDYMNHFGKMPSDYSASTYDALVLAVAALARMDADPSKTPDKAMLEVVSGREVQTGWNAQDVSRAVRMIRAGGLPDLNGASGPLDYCSKDSTDPLTTWYALWRVEKGRFHTDDYVPVSSDNENLCISAGSSLKSKIITDSKNWVNDPRKMVTVVYTGEKGDFGFNDGVYLGLIKARDNMNLFTREILWNLSEPGPDPVIDNETGMRSDMVVIIGDMTVDYAESISDKYPDVPVVIIDVGSDEGRKLKSVSFQMYGASYLAGILAANQTKTGKIAVIAGKDAPVISSFSDGFIAGAKSEDPDIVVNVTYLAKDNSGFTMPEKAAEITDNMYNNGTDIIFTIAGGSGLGVITEAKKLPGMRVIGVDSDQSDLGPGVVLASVAKNLDTVVDREIEAGINGSFKPGLEVTGIETNGSSLVFNPGFSNLSSIIENRYAEAIEMEEKYSLSHS